MDQNLFDTYAPLLRSWSAAELEQEIATPRRLLIASRVSGARRIEIAYAPFDHINPAARIVIVGITPGRQQMGNALREARRLLLAGKSNAEAASGAKVFASFSGPMRSNLTAMLDHVGVHQHLGIVSTSTLWNGDASLVHFTSALRYPVFVDGENYSGNPSMVSEPLLQEHLLRWFGAEMMALPDALFIPLGPKVADAVAFVGNRLGVDADRILDGFQHPSGANAERIAFFLDRKQRDKLSRKVNPSAVLEGRERILAKLPRWRTRRGGSGSTSN